MAVVSGASGRPEGGPGWAQLLSRPSRMSVSWPRCWVWWEALRPPLLPAWAAALTSGRQTLGHFIPCLHLHPPSRRRGGFGKGRRGRPASGFPGHLPGEA